LGYGIGVLRALCPRGVFALALLAAVSGCSSQATPEGAPPATSSRFIGGGIPAGMTAADFTLRDYRGHVVSMRGLRGKVVALTFLDTRCTTKCPITASEIGAGVRLLPAADRHQIAVLGLTVNPNVDTPSSIRRFLGRTRSLGIIDYLVGSVSELTQVWKAYYILSAVKTGNDDVHSSEVRIFNRRGEWVSSLNAGADLSPANLAHDLRAALAP